MSVQHKGQVYIPLINYLLMALCLIIVGTFQTSTNIGRAYGERPFLLTQVKQFILACKLFSESSIGLSYFYIPAHLVTRSAVSLLSNTLEPSAAKFGPFWVDETSQH